MWLVRLHRNQRLATGVIKHYVHQRNVIGVSVNVHHYLVRK